MRISARVAPTGMTLKVLSLLGTIYDAKYNDSRYLFVSGDNCRSELRFLILSFWLVQS
jgi:hypothetical protein